jgi:predicted transposase/invertase (TIGR01784 family)
MRRDSIFYKLFSQFPDLLFELMMDPPPNSVGYQFESVEVKETAFRIDGVFLPPDDAQPKVVCFAEVQLQKDEELYDRFFAETAYFLRRATGNYHDWRGVLIFTDRQVTPSNAYLHRSLLNGPQVEQIYLDQLSNSSQDSLGVRLIQLTMATETEAIAQAKLLLEQVPQQATLKQSESTIMNLITTIMVYKLSTLSREEIEAMLGLNLSESRVLREERQEGRQEEGRSLVLRLLTRRVGSVPKRLVAQIQELSLPQIESLGEALLDFTELEDLEAWLNSDRL